MVSVVPWPRCFHLATARCSWLPEKEGKKHTMPTLFPKLTNRTSRPAWNLERGKEFEALQLRKRHAKQAQSLRNVSEERTALKTERPSPHQGARLGEEISKRPRRPTRELGPSSRSFSFALQNRCNTVQQSIQKANLIPTQTSKSNHITLMCF